MATFPEVLNPDLYRRLLRRFGEVRITHPGEKRVARIVRGLEDDLKLFVQQHGETYRVRCPFCKDQSYQLSINHIYGQRDSDSGRQLLNLAYCHASNCLVDYECRAKLADMLKADDGWLEDARILPGKVISDEERKIELPGPLTRLDKLPSDHPARKCLVERGLDPDRVGKVYKASYCGHSNESVARNCIIIPVEMGGRLRGWQAMPLRSSSVSGRVLPPRYFSAPGMESSTLIYNLDRARQYETAVLVKGPADVWRLGPMALCPVTRKVSQDQVRKLLSVFRNATLVLLLGDNELVQPDVRRLVSEMRPKMSGRFAAIPLPKEESPSRLFLRKHVIKEAGKRGVRVCFDKRE
jgi:hypothetical protein